MESYFVNYWQEGVGDVEVKLPSHKAAIHFLEDLAKTAKTLKIDITIDSFIIMEYTDICHAKS